MPNQANDTYDMMEIPEHLREFFAPVGGGDGVATATRNSHPT